MFYSTQFFLDQLSCFNKGTFALLALLEKGERAMPCDPVSAFLFASTGNSNSFKDFKIFAWRMCHFYRQVDGVP